MARRECETCGEQGHAIDGDGWSTTVVKTPSGHTQICREDDGTVVVHT